LEELKKKFLGMNDDEIKDVKIELPKLEKEKSFFQKIFRRKS